MATTRRGAPLDGAPVADDGGKHEAAFARRPLLTTAFALAFGIVVASFLAIAIANLTGNASTGITPGADYAVFHSAARLTVEGNGADVYDPAILGERIASEMGRPDAADYPYGLPPFLQLLFIPLALWPFRVGYVLFTVGSLVAVAVAAKYLGSRHPVRVAGLVAASMAGFWTLLLGQTGLWAGAVLFGVYISLCQRRQFTAGLLLGLLAFKPAYVVGVGLWWLLRFRKHRMAMFGVAVSTGALVLSGLLIPGAWSAFASVGADSGPDFVERLSTSGFSLLEMWTSLLSLPGLALGLWLLSVFLVVRWLHRMLGGLDGRLALSFSAAVVVGLLVSPRTGWYDWTLLVVPAVLAWQASPRLRPDSLVAGAWLFVASALSWLVGERLVGSIGIHIQIAPIVLAGVAWYWFDRVERLQMSDRQPVAHT